jgi:hypothetical protein
MGWHSMAGIHFAKFESTVAKLCHAFTCIPAGVGLLLPCNRVLKTWPNVVYLHKKSQGTHCTRRLLHPNTQIHQRTHALSGTYKWMVGLCGCHQRLRAGCREGIIGKLSACTPTVFLWQWLDDIKVKIASFNNPTSNITNSDLKIASLLLLWLTIKGVCGPLHEKRVTLF